VKPLSHVLANPRVTSGAVAKSPEKSILGPFEKPILLMVHHPLVEETAHFHLRRQEWLLLIGDDDFTGAGSDGTERDSEQHRRQNGS
jgi:hypothetical protein